MTTTKPVVIKIPLRGSTVEVTLGMGLLHRLCRETGYGLQEILESLETMRLDIMGDALAVMLRDTLPDATGESVLEEYGMRGLIEAWQVIGEGFNEAFADIIALGEEGNAGGESEHSPASNSG